MTSEEEQLKQLKNWWKDNGVSTIATVVVAVSVALGWQGWQKNQAAKQEAAAVAYQQFLVALADSERSDGDDIKIAQTTHQANQLKEEYEGTGFSLFAALHNARQALADKDYALAEQELEWVLERTEEPEVQSIAHMRLARVYLAQADHEKALAATAMVNSVAFEPLSAELRGDIYMAQSQYQQAFDAYSKAQELAIASQLETSAMLASKVQYAQSYL